MTWRTNSFVIACRGVGRALGFNRWLSSYLQRSGYEVKYDNAFSEMLKVGDCVWDVGANVGYYTRIFSEKVGSRGRVFAFEPSPVNFKRLSASTADLKNVSLLQLGLGNENGKLAFLQGADNLGATSRVSKYVPGEVSVDIQTGGSLIQEGKALRPNAIKIDVEGFEYEVLDGLADQLLLSSLRVLGIEVHFGILKERGMPHVPQSIESLLKNNGFVVNWPDASHIIAVRENQ